MNTPDSLPQTPDPWPNQPPPPVLRVQRAIRAPSITYLLLAVTVLLFLVQLAGETLLGADLAAYYGMKINELILRGQLWRLFTPMFLHGSILHLLFNMYALYQFGRTLEGPYGHGRFLVLYGLSGFTGNVLSFLLAPNPSLGASTAIFGLLAAEGIFVYRNRQLFGPNAPRVLNNILTVAAINLLLGMSPGIDNWGHIGGLIGGALFAWFAGPLLRVEGFYPSFQVVDARATRETLLTGTLVGCLFASLVFLKMLL